ncbi:SusC/RagA family TonB-linked outer membrane protein [Sphingobacterium spiritivorum]|uniref:TonB-linked outer membrane protein, SusC/RagA family n=1 Tax=Sphingobacterium spiritivorum ATCC 33861 TaxID=525373 RepID=D7VQ74_SPHSI|nr:SusC/RagA family TonB-linked outer membrane protein [Sphingobacterium spiritivorum]EFK55925.1 TonB-linked outer membrane protein, SusC/RagA family [Sphingobacterium spiritivorum ATCC 33861]QQT35938.1 SusC/RagA family TonB-linked outer membrane protein [Sphingobacterium spiritivorum]WQD32667.1 SusC/RagA family TonB-linked outer membrane protein [Sphingobacterium spiritivorum]
MYKIYRHKLAVMRLTVALLLITFMQLSAFTYGQRINLNEQKSSIENILKKIRRQTGYDFLFHNSLNKSVGLIDLKLKNASLEEALKSLCELANLTYSIDGKIVVIEAARKTSAHLTTQETEVKGRVVDENGKPLEGASVAIVVEEYTEDKKTTNFEITTKGTKVAAQTDANGKFVLKNVNQKAILYISYIGYETFSATAAANMGTITLHPAKNQIQEVVVNTGYQKIAKSLSPGSSINPDMKIIAERSFSMNVLQRLDGLVPGLVVNNSPSASNNPFLIRGVTTINANRNPLVVVDGIAMDMANINSVNPQDIDDITVLKDANSTAIWGARASNGVIVITTKRGKTGSIKISYDGFVNFQGKPDYKYFPVLNSAQYIQASRETFDPVYWPYSIATNYNPYMGTFSGISPDRQIMYDMERGVLTQAQGNAKLDSLSRISNLDQMGDIFYRNAMLTNHTISISGGGDKHNFYNSAAYTNNRSSTPGSKDQTFKFNTRQDFSFTKRIRLYVIADLSYQTASSTNWVSPDNRFVPYQLFKNSAGNPIDMSYLGLLSEEQRPTIENKGKIGLNYNPIDDANTGFRNRKNFTGRFNSGLTVDIVKGLRFEGVYGYVHGSNRMQQYYDRTNYNQRINILNFAVANSNGTVTYNLPNAGGQYSVSNATQQNWVFRNQLDYTADWKNKQHQLSALIGQEVQEQRTISNSSTVYGYNIDLQSYAMLDYLSLVNPGIRNPILAQVNNPSRSVLEANSFFGEIESVPRNRFISYYANANYAFDRKYSLSASWRNDRSNLFGLNKAAQRKPVWSVGLRWNMHHERWMQNVQQTISQLALRATYGITGNPPMPGYATSKDILSPVTTSASPDGQALIITSYANPYLTWESTKTYNAGLDFGLLKNRISGALDIYYKNTSNLLGNLPINPLAGSGYISGNIGSLSNKGIELLLNSKNIVKSDFAWNSLFTLSYNQNKITNLGMLQNPIVTAQNQVANDFTAGYPAFAIFAYNYGGLDKEGNPLLRKADGSLTKDQFNTQPSDALFMGPYQPKWSGGLANQFIYKDFSFNVNMVFNLGSVMFRNVNQTYTGGYLVRGREFTKGNLHADFANRWKQPGDEAKTDIPAFIANPKESGRGRFTDYYVRGSTNVVSADFAKIREMSLSYQIPKKLLGKIKAEGLSFRLQISNLMLWKNNNYGIDPEFQHARFDTGTIPVNQNTITLGARLTL